MAASNGAAGAYLEPDSVITEERTDSGYSDSESTRSASITSSITGYKYENGRRYHAYREGAYYLPNDDAEQARLDLIHHIHRLCLDGSLYFAPLEKENIKRCLDFGTGTGIWAIDFADEFPDAEVIGTDLSPIQPTWVPPNLKFYVDDVEGDWAYNSDEAFDLIHGRGMGGAIKDWTKLLRQCYDNLKPGAYLEMHDYESWWYSQSDPELKGCPYAKQWVELVNEGSSQFGNELNMGPKLKALMEKAGFLDVEEKVVRVPVGPWAKGQKPKEMGVFQRENVLDCVDSYTMPLLTRVLGWKVDETEVLMARAKSDLRDPVHQIYVNYYFLHGKKPDS